MFIVCSIVVFIFFFEVLLIGLKLERMPLPLKLYATSSFICHTWTQTIYRNIKKTGNVQILKRRQFFNLTQAAKAVAGRASGDAAKALKTAPGLLRSVRLQPIPGG